LTEWQQEYRLAASTVAGLAKLRHLEQVETTIPD
jgi:hypothetical protein